MEVEAPQQQSEQQAERELPFSEEELAVCYKVRGGRKMCSELPSS